MVLMEPFEVPLRHVELGQVVAHLLGHRGGRLPVAMRRRSTGRLTVASLLRRHQAQGLQNDPLSW